MVTYLRRKSNKKFVFLKKYLFSFFGDFYKKARPHPCARALFTSYKPALTRLMASTAAAEPLRGYSSKAIIWP